MAILGSLSWSPTYDATDVAGWRIYASLEESDQRGSAVMLATADARYAEFELEEGTWFVRLCRVFKNGSEEDWSTVTPTEIDVHARQEAPPTPTDVEVAHVEQTSTIRVSDEPPLASETQPYTTEVVEGPDAYRGKVVAETSVETAGPLYPDGQRIASPTVPLEAETTDTTRDLIVRNVSVGGRAGPAVTRTVATPPTLGSDFHEVPLVECHGTTHTGIPNSSTTTPYEFDATDGIRLKAFPAPASLDADWTTLLNANEYAGPYIDNAMIESDELDVGAVTTFRLLSRDQTQRKSDTAYAWSAPPDDLVYIPPDPLPGYRGAALNPNWLMREVDGDGRPRRPIRPQDAEVRYIVSSSPGFAHARADYKRYDGGTWLRGRYVRVALFLREPLGQFQLIVPRWIVSALLPRTVGTVTGSPEGAVVAVPGSTRTRLDGPPHHYVKATGLGNTGWLASNVLADGTVTNAKLADMAQSRIKGRAAGAGTGAPTDLTPAQATAVLDAMVGDSGSGGTKGLVPAPAAGDAAASKFLKADGTWATTPGGAPSGSAGGDLTGTYPNPTLASSGPGAVGPLGDQDTVPVVTTDAKGRVSALTTTAIRANAVAGTPSMRKLGTGSTDAAAGDDSRFTDARNPLAYVHTDAQTDIVNDSSEQTLWSKSVASMAAGDRVLVDFGGDYLNDSGGARTFTVRVKFGSTTLWQCDSPSMAKSSLRRAMNMRFVLSAFGATNAQRVTGWFVVGLAASPTTGTGTFGAGPFGGAFYGSSAEDTTSAKTLSVTIQHSTNDANLSIRLQHGTAEFIKA